MADELIVKIEVKVYKCEYCRKQHVNPVDRAKCEISCEAENRRKEELDKARKLQEEKSQMFNEIQCDSKKLATKISTYNKKFNTNYNDYNFPIVVDLSYTGDSLSELISQMERYSRSNKHAG